jgi:hypothetical protein
MPLTAGDALRLSLPVNPFWPLVMQSNADEFPANTVSNCFTAEMLKSAVFGSRTVGTCEKKASASI